MNCADLLKLIDDYVDGELPRSSRSEARAHLVECASCRAEEARVRALTGAAAALPEELPLPRDLWARIDARLREGEAGAPPVPSALPRGRHAALAAAMIVVLVGGAVAAALLFRQPAPPAIPAGAEAVAPAAGGDSPAAVPLDEAGKALLEAKQSLKEAFSQQSGSLSPGTVRQVEENIQIIEAAVAEIQAALAKDPGNPQLRKLLITARQREVAVLTKVTRTAAARQVRW